MKKYFYSNEQGELGPVTLEELKQKDITLKTLIWHEGLDDWKEAESIDELKEIFELGPRRIDKKVEVSDLNTPSDSNENKSKSPNASKKYIWLILILILSFGIGYGIGFFDEDEDDQYNLNMVDKTLTPTLVETEDSNKVFNAVSDVNIYTSNIYIKSKKAYFYSYPNKESRKTTYVIMGDNIQYDPRSLVNGFYNSKFINANNKTTTSGWIHQDAIFPDQKTMIDAESANNFDHSASVTYIKINDPEGYTNVRAGKSTSTEIIYQIYDENKLFELLDDSGNWWKIKLDSSGTKTSTGFIYKSKVIKVSNSQSD